MEQMQDIPEWWPSRPPIYDICKSYEENSKDGPFMSSYQIPSRILIPKDQWIDFLGYKVASPLGVPAGPLLNSNWINLASQLGFDVPTYKTIRSKSHVGHPLPNVLYINPPDLECEDIEGQQIDSTPSKTKQVLIAESTPTLPAAMDGLAITNSFGMPSQSREYLIEDIRKANQSLQEGQVMIVSVVGTPPAKETTCGSCHCSATSDYTEFVRDFVEVASFAKDCGANIIEANFSCPNVATGEGQIYQNPSSVLDIASSITRAIGDTPLIIKIGTYTDRKLMTQVLQNARDAKVRAVCGINTVSMQVIDPLTKKPALGPTRLTSGVCGGPIRKVALNFVKQASEIVKKEQLPLIVMGCGGITKAEHFQQFLDAGASVALSATGMMWDPYLAARYHHFYEKDKQ